MIRTIIDAAGFISILPTGMEEPEKVAKGMYQFPIIGAFLGFAAGIFIYLLLGSFPPMISSVLGVFFLLILTGLHHLDGLLDFGDAVMFRGTRERRIEVLHDTNTGVGGFSLGFFVILLTILIAEEYVVSGGSPVALLAVAESLSKFAMVVTAGFGIPAFEGTGSIFIETVKKSMWQLPASFLIAGTISAYVFGVEAVVLLALPLIVSLAIVRISTVLIGGVSGDVFGAVNEITRTACMLVMLWML